MKATTQLFEQEGRHNLKAAITSVAKAANAFDVEKIVIFAAHADGVLKLRSLVDESREVIAVTFPAGYTAMVSEVWSYVGLTSPEDRQRVEAAGIKIVQGTMPLVGFGGDESAEIRSFRSALDLFGGGLKLCVQALLMACDAGAVQSGRRCIAMSADSAIVAHSENAFRALSSSSRFAIEHIICKPVSYVVTRPSVVPPSDGRKAVIGLGVRGGIDALPGISEDEDDSRLSSE